MFKTEYRMFTLATKVLAVAVINKRNDTGKLFDWTAYIDAVPGQNHEEEYMDVARVGDKLPKEIGIILFPNLDSNKWRY